uniref:ANK_REP_REGION domain-containing protein n=1 Tax=Nippostrongylus brasiliensis TaxID=27835 RepID=A0A0N4XCE3_NIPBR
LSNCLTHLNGRNAVTAKNKELEAIEKVTLDAKSFEKVKQLHREWYFYALKALLGQMAKELLRTMDRRLKLCLKRVIRTNDLKNTASCLIRAREQWKKQSESATLPSLPEVTTKSPVHRVSNLFASLFGKIPTKDLSRKWSTTYRKMVKVAKILEKNEKLPGARVYEARVYDLAVGNGARRTRENQVSFDLHRVFTKKLITVPAAVKSVFDIVTSFKGSGSSRVLSPRIAPLVPDRSRSQRVLSPSLFPFYNDEAEEQIMPIPKVLESAGLNENDREKVLAMVMEVSGARETVDNAIKRYFLEYRSLFHIGNIFEQLRSSFSKMQRIEMKRRGYTFMDQQQMRRLHEQQGRETDQRRHLYLLPLISVQGRSKRQISVLAPVVLSPFQFAPVYGLSILGPVVLSPNIFAPLILNPAVLSAWVLSPALPLPFIISPYLLSPYVLSPLGFAPFILTPYVLSPNVINPYFLSPVILSPVVLSPDVISPMVLGGQILSPSVLSPSVLSKSYLMANVLSPSFLS